MNTSKPVLGVKAKDDHYDIVAFIGRFSPLTLAHIDIINAALERGRRVVINIGSCFQPRTDRVPFTFDEREEMIRAQFPNCDRIAIKPVIDSPYSNTEWVVQVRDNVSSAAREFGVTNPSVALIGHKKDFGTSFYLDMFPDWDEIAIPNLYDNLSATTVRERIFEDTLDSFHSIVADNLVTSDTSNVISTAMDEESWRDLIDEISYATSYKKDFDDAAELIAKRRGFKPEIQHQCVDNVVICSGHILLIQRKNLPGRGLWALAGGHLHEEKSPNEWTIDAALRELREETKIKVPLPVLRGSIRGHMIADYPYRSMRGRVISTVYLIVLANGQLPPIKGRSDAKMATWVPISDLRPDNMFEDHYHIAMKMIGQLKDKEY